jgi:hypothetical protein
MGHQDGGIRVRLKNAIIAFREGFSRHPAMPYERFLFNTRKSPTAFGVCK